MSFSFTVFSFVDVSISRLELTLSVLLPILESTRVNVSIFVRDLPLAVHLVVQPLALVDRAVW